MHGSDLRLFAHRLDYERVPVARGSQVGFETLARCRCPAAPEFTSELAPHAGGHRAVNRQHHEHVAAAEGPKLPNLTQAQEQLLLSWDEAAMLLRPSGPPAGDRWHASAARLVQLGLLELRSTWGAIESYRAEGLRPTARGRQMIRLLTLRNEADPWRRRAAAGH